MKLIRFAVTIAPTVAHAQGVCADYGRYLAKDVDTVLDRLSRDKNLIDIPRTEIYILPVR